MPEAYIALSGTGPKTEGLKWESDLLLRIGRRASLEVVLRDTSVQRLHAEIKFEGQRWMLKDLAASSFYPTFLNGKNIADKPVAVKLNDIIQVGKLKVRVSAIGLEMMESAAEPPAPVAAEGPAVPGIFQKGQPAPNETTPVPGVTKPGVLVMTGIKGAPLRDPNGMPGTPGPNVDLQVFKVQASTLQTWDQALEKATSSQGWRPNSNRAMLTLLRANHPLSSQASLGDLLDNMLGDILQSLDAQRAAVLLLNPLTGQLELKALLAPSPITTGKKSYSRSLAERSYHQGESLLCRDIRGEHDLRAAHSALFGSMASIICAVMRTPRKRLGVLHLDRGPLQEPFAESDLYLADAVAANMAVGVECAQLIASQSEQYLQTVTTLAQSAALRDQYTGGHIERVTEFALMLADDLKLSSTERYQIQVGTPLHDLGKINIDDAVLRKPGKLTDGEFEHVKSHTIKGAAMLDGFFNLAPLIPILRSHHERWDGTGYPDRHSRDGIAIAARIVAVADTFDAMTSPRPYRPALPPQLAFLELISKSGTHFDPHVVQSFVKLRPRVEDIMRSHHAAK